MSTTIVQVELGDLDVTVSVGVHKDPGGEFEEADAAPRPPVASTTVGPHRYTIHVPHDDASMFSMGQGSPGHIKDTGITARTNTHMHFETRESPKTIVSLGGPTQDAMVCSFDESVLAKSKGFAMVTEAHAWMESVGKFDIYSTTDDVVVRALKEDKRVVVQADHGHVDVTSGHTVNLVSQTVNITSPMEPALDQLGYGDAWSDQKPDMHSTENWMHGVEIVACASVAVDLFIEAKNFIGHKRYKGSTESPYMKPAMTGLHWVATAARIGLTTAHVLSAMKHHHAEGMVKIGTAKDFGAIAGATANVFGKTGATLGSAMFSTVVAPLATLEGVLFAGVAGKHAAMLGLTGVEIGAPLGTTYIEAKKELELDCHGPIKIGGHGDVFMRSGHHGAYVHGIEKAYLGSGKGTGFGALATGDDVVVGKFSSAENFSAAAIDPDCSIKVNEESITAFHKKAGFAVRDNKVTLHSNGKAGELLIDGSEIKVDGSRICLA